jgi:hypothetical protein
MTNGETRTVDFTNRGSARLTINGAAIADDPRTNFSVVSNNCGSVDGGNLFPGSFCTIGVKAQCGNAPATGVLRVTSNSTGRSPYDVALTCNR